MRQKLLIVDDEPGIVDMLKSYFEPQYEVLTAYSGDEALRKVAAVPDLILLDINMPGMDGLAVCRKIRTYITCPILFLTARLEAADKIGGFGAGADDYIVKPFDLDELGARVAAHLRRETREKKHAVTVDGAMFYLKEKKVRYGEMELGFTKSEYAICEYLAMNRGQVFSKDRIYEHVFGYDKESDPSVITEHVKNIRAKCQKAGFQPIETVWGIGYKAGDFENE